MMIFFADAWMDNLRLQEIEAIFYLFLYVYDDECTSIAKLRT